MSDRPTPETDAEWDRLQMLPGGGYSSQVAGVKLAFGMAAWASTLERQRDEARELARELMNELAWKGKLVGLSLSQQKVITKAKEVLP